MASRPVAVLRRLPGAYRTTGTARLGRSTRGGLALGVASVLSNGLGYAFTVVLARAFGPAEYGALVALLGAGLIGTIPASGLQYVVARRTVALGLPPDRNDGATLVLATGTGVALLLVATAVSPLAGSFLHLSGASPVLALGVALVPMTLAGAVQGALLGHGRFTALGTVYVVTAVGRFAGGVLTALAGWGVTGAMGTLAAAAVVTTAFAWLLTGPRSWPGLRAAASRWRVERALAGDVARSCSAVAGIIVLSNVDVLLARHYLDRETSGAYAVASLFAKALLWGAQFVVQAAYPALARPDGRRRLLRLALAGSAGVGLVGVLLTAVAAGPVVGAVTGQADYGEAVHLAPAFALLGLGWTLAQTLLLAAVAAGNRRPGRLLWLVIAAEAAAVATTLHHSPGQILAACLVAVAAYVAIAALLERSPAGGHADGRDPGPPAAQPAAAAPGDANGRRAGPAGSRADGPDPGPAARPPVAPAAADANGRAARYPAGPGGGRGAG